MEARLKWLEERTFLATSGTGHSFVLGSTKGSDGKALQASPMELVLIGMAGCTAYDVIHILEKGRVHVEDMDLSVNAVRATEDPKVFTHIAVLYRFTGANLDRNKLERAVTLSAEKYCSASAMIAKTADIKFEIEIIKS